MLTRSYGWTPSRRNFLAGAAAGVAVAGMVGVRPGRAAGTSKVDLQLGFFANGNQLGEIVAKRAGYYNDVGLDLTIQPGGPNNDGIALVASGKFGIGQISSSPSLMLAASQDLPIQCFGVGAQRHPYCFFSLKKNPVHTPADLKGKKVGIQATGVILLKALLAKNKIDEKDVQIITVGGDPGPLLTGQVDVFTAWTTNTTQLKALGDQRVDMTLWDTGVHLYALPYYATSDTIKNHADTLGKFLQATGHGWDFARQNPEKAVDYLVQESPTSIKADEIEAAKVMLSVEFDATTKAAGWGTMSAQVWQEQIDLWSQLGQFTKKTPKLADVMTMDVLKATEKDRPKVG